MNWTGLITNRKTGVPMRNLFALLAVTVLAGSPTLAFAQDEGIRDDAESPKTAEELPAETMGGQTETPVAAPEAAPAEEPKFPEHEFNGWVDTSFVYDQQSNVIGYQMAQVGLRMGHRISENYGGFVQLNGFSTGNDLTVRAREAYGYYQTDEGGFKLLAGKYYAPIGFELADPPDLYQFSNSLVFTNLIPTELVGAMAVFGLGDFGDFKLYTSGPWDNDLGALTMGTKNFGGRLGISLGDLGGIGLSAVGGPQVDEGLLRIAYDLDAAIQATDKVLIGAEANLNMVEGRYVDAAGAPATGFAMPLGFLVMTNIAFTDLFNLTLRYDMVKDAAFDDGGVQFLAFDYAGDGQTDVTLSSITVGPNFHLADGWDVFTEVRYDMASEPLFTIDGNAEKGSMSAAAELIYQF